MTFFGLYCLAYVLMMAKEKLSKAKSCLGFLFLGTIYLTIICLAGIVYLFGIWLILIIDIIIQIVKKNKKKKYMEEVRRNKRVARIQRLENTTSKEETSYKMNAPSIEINNLNTFIVVLIIVIILVLIIMKHLGYTI